MQSLSLANPIDNTLFHPVLLRTIMLYGLGFLLILILNNGKIQGLWANNVGKRYLSWAVIGPLYVFMVFLSGYASLSFLLTVLWLALWEIYIIKTLPLKHIIGLAGLSVIAIMVGYFIPEYFYSFPLISFLVITSISIAENSAQKSFLNAAISNFISIWLIFSLSHFILLGQLDAATNNNRALLLMLGFAVPLSDIFAYLVGRFFKRIPALDDVKVASNLSSKKSYAGALGNILGAGVGIWIMHFATQDLFSVWQWCILALLLGAGGLVGDITESMFKRYYRVKDSGTLLPGHGGVLDRIDSMLRAVVILYYFTLFFHV